MEIVLVGLNHKSAPVAVRERLAFGPEESRRELARLVSQTGLSEAVIVSTCNRTEVYGATGDGPEGLDNVRGFLAAFARWKPEDLAPMLYQLTGADAACHLGRVAAGLDSMLVGESQILGQVRAALRHAREAGTAGPYLSRLFEAAMRAGKRARAETPIGEGAMSISHAAVQLAAKMFGSLRDRDVLLIGAGKVADLVARHLSRHGAARVRVANRNPQRAERLAAAYSWNAVPLTSLGQWLEKSDIVISSTGAPEPIIDVPMAQAALKRRNGRPLLLVDLAVPRDVDPGVAGLSGAVVYNIDDLQSVVDSAVARRREYLEQADAIVRETMDEYLAWYRERMVSPVIARLRRRAEAIRERELDKALRRLNHLPEADKERIRALSSAIVNKLLHEPTVRLKEHARAGVGEELARVVDELFASADEFDRTATRRSG